VLCGQWPYPNWIAERIRFGLLNWNDPLGLGMLGGLFTSEPIVHSPGTDFAYYIRYFDNGTGTYPVASSFFITLDATKKSVHYDWYIYCLGVFQGWFEQPANNTGATFDAMVHWNPAVATPTYPQIGLGFPSVYPEPW